MIVMLWQNLEHAINKLYSLFCKNEQQLTLHITATALCPAEITTIATGMSIAIIV